MDLGSNSMIFASRKHSICHTKIQNEKCSCTKTSDTVKIRLNCGFFPGEMKWFGQNAKEKLRRKSSKMSERYTQTL